MAVMSRANFAKQLEEGLNAIFGMAYSEYPEQYAPVFDAETSRKAYEEDVLLTGFGAAPIRGEGEPLAYDEGREAWAARYQHIEVAMGFHITRIAVEDNLYGNLGAKYSRAMARSVKETREILGAAIFNYSTDTSPENLGGDGEPLLSENHPLTGGGVASNKLSTPGDFDEANLESILIQMRKAVDDRLLPIALNPVGVVLPPDTEFDATRLLRSQYRVGTDFNDLNAINYLGILSKNPHMMVRLTNPKSWWVLSDCPDGLKMFRRIPLQTGMEGDFETDNLKYKCRERYSFGWTDWRRVWGSEGT